MKRFSKFLTMFEGGPTISYVKWILLRTHETAGHLQTLMLVIYR